MLNQLRLLPLLLLAIDMRGMAQTSESALRAEPIPTFTTLGIESVQLPEGEHMGLVGGSLLFDIGDDWAVGPAVYGAATGKRGGLFVGGFELQRRWSLGNGFALAAGMFAGGGGGAAAPVGSGLMLRPALTLLKDLGPSLQGGLSLSHVRFPSGDISSTQVGLVLAWRNEFRHFVGGQSGDAVAIQQSSGIGIERALITAGQYRFNDGSARRIGLIGARAEHRIGKDGWTWGLEAAAAATGDAAGYMEVLGSAGASTALLPDALPTWRVGVRAAAGLGGGGAVPTGGGVIGKAVATTEWSPLAGWTLGAELGAVRSAGGSLSARHAQLWLGVDLEPAFDGRNEAIGRLVRVEWSPVLQRQTRSLRSDGTQQSIDTVGLKLNRYTGENVYLTGQAHSAFAGGAGAYSIGLLGAGVATRPSATTRIGAELLVGAAGGAGVQTGGGAITQGLLWAGWAPSPGGEWRIGVGKVRALRGGGLDSPLLELSWAHSFGISGR